MNTKHPAGVYTPEQIEAGLDRLIDDLDDVAPKLPCPRCGGEGERKDDETGRIDVCRKCGGSGLAAPDDADADAALDLERPDRFSTEENP